MDSNSPSTRNIHYRYASGMETEVNDAKKFCPLSLGTIKFGINSW